MDELLPILQRANREGLSLSALIILIAIFSGKDTRPSYLAKLANMTAAGATTILDRLVRLDIVKRVDAPHDRRSFNIELTPKGAEVMGRVLAPQLENPS